jgi:hypothetical protein
MAYDELMAVSAPGFAPRLLAALTLSLALGVARAEDGAYETDPPARAARLSYLQGDVSMQPAGEQDWAPALLNRPLTTGDKLWTEQGARAEIQVGQASVRLDGDTGFSFLNVDDDTIQMRMTAGVINVRVRALIENDHIEIDTPNVALSLLQPGNYRVEVNDPGDTTVMKISEGQAEATGPGQSVVVRNQQVATFRGTDPLTAQFGTLGGPDEFDSWSLERDHRDDRVASSPTSEYVSPDVTGYEDLDDNGTWSSEAEYGYVWTPSRVAVGWAPYQYGRWVWVSPWGWTWVDDAPWGYAPFHYGRWAHLRNRWCWVPGPRHVRAVYAPALVGWVGSPGVGVSVAIGQRVGWFPLGPREVYVPARRFSPRYVERVNVTNTVIVKRGWISHVYDRRDHPYNYRNRAVPGAVTTVSRTTFTSAGRVGEHRVRLDPRQQSRATVAARPPQIAPARESRLGGAVRTNFRPPPRAVVDRPVIVKRAPPTVSGHLARDVANRVPPATAPERRPHDFGDRPDRPPRHVSSAPKPMPTLQPPAQRPQVVSPRADRLQVGRPPAERPRDDRPARDRQRQEAERNQRVQEFQREAGARQAAQRQRASERARTERPTESRRPEVRQPQIRQPETRRPEVRRPEVRRPEVRRPEVRQPASHSPDRSSRPASPAPQRPAASRPMPWKNEARRPDPK